MYGDSQLVVGSAWARGVSLPAPSLGCCEDPAVPMSALCSKLSSATLELMPQVTVSTSQTLPCTVAGAWQ